MSDNIPTCDHPGCGAPITHCSSEWRTPDWLAISYWCVEHAPEGAESIEDELADPAFEDNDE